MTQIIEDGYGGNNDPLDNLTIRDKARIKAHNYADDNEDEVVMLRQDEGISLHSILKNAYEQGYLDGVIFRLTGGNDD